MGIKRAFKKAVQDVGRVVNVIPMAKPTIKLIDNQITQPVNDTIRDTHNVMKSLNNPGHPLGVMADSADRVIASANKDIIKTLGDRANDLASNAAKKAEDLKMTKLSSVEEELERKGRGRAATLLNGPTGLQDGPRISRRILLGF